MIQRIGVFDSGLGGLTVLNSLMRTIPGIEYIYLGDTARTPYGSKSSSTIESYAREAHQFFCRNEIDLLVVACNTVSAVALHSIEETSPFPIIGTIEPAIEACSQQSLSGPVGVIGTAATIASEAYQRRLREVFPNISIESVACPLFVPLVEESLTDGPIVESVIDYYLGSLRLKRPEIVILGCTHYPLLRSALQQYIGPEVRLVECSDAIAKKVSKMVDAGVSRTEEKEEATDADSPKCLSTPPLSAAYPAVWDKNVDTANGNRAHRRPISRFFVTDAVSRFNSLARKYLNSSEVQAIKVESLLSDPEVT